MPVIFAQHRAAAGREHDVIQAGELLEDGGLARTETRFAFDFEDDRNFDTGAPLDFLIAIVERLAEPFREQASDRRFAGAHQPDQKDAAGNRRTCERGGWRVRHAMIVT